MSTQDFYSYRRVNAQLITSGQPTEEQIKCAADEEIKTVINLRPPIRSHPCPMKEDWFKRSDAGLESFGNLFVGEIVSSEL